MVLGQHGPTQPEPWDRRRFLFGMTAAAAGLVAGCTDPAGNAGGGPLDPGSDAGTGRTASVPTTVSVPSPRHVVDLATDPFTLGVASGDPLSDAVVLWTRLAPDPLADDGAGGMPDEPVDVVWEVADDAAFRRPVAAGLATAVAGHGHSVHVDVTGLVAATDYHYRFTVGRWTSPVGRTRTLPAGSPERFVLAVANCQMLESGLWGAYRHLVDEDVDVVLHLGDYIYEYPALGDVRPPRPDRLITTLADYRLRYASYKVEPELRDAHARFPFVVTWDDHEVANNYMGDLLAGRPDPADGRARKAAAYQAWWEHLPVRTGPPDGADLVVHRAFTVGDLLRLHVLDVRQDADVPPCRPETPGDGLTESDYGDCAERDDPDRNRLGVDQEQWLDGSLAAGGVTWNLLGNPVVLAGIDGGDEEAAYYLDTWDGYPAARRRLIDRLAEVTNPVVLTGDYHAGMTLDVHAEPFDQASAVVAPEFMAPPISSILFPADVSTRTPHLREQLNGHGYLVVTVAPATLDVEFRVVDDVRDPDTAIETAAAWRVGAGDPVARRR